MTLTGELIRAPVVSPRRVALRVPSWAEEETPAVAAAPRVTPAHEARLEEAIFNQLSFARRGAAGYASCEEMRDAYFEALKTVADKGEQLRRFFQALGRLLGEYRVLGQYPPNTLRRRTLRARTDALVRRIGYEPPTAAPCLVCTPHLPLEDCYVHWAQVIRGHIADLVSALYGTLDRCVEEQLVGRISWSSPTCCSFTFFREVIICHDDVRLEWRNGNYFYAGTHTFYHAVHCHALINAREHQVRPRDFSLPPRVGEAWGHFPAWLRPHLRFVTGTVAKQRIVERELGSETWKHIEPKLNTADPALVLDGGYVLTGWGLDEERYAPAPAPAPKRSLWRSLRSLLRLWA